VVAETALVAAKAAADSALADLDREREVLSQLRAGSRSEELDAQRARVSQAESLLQSARLQLQRTSIAPAFDAVVSQLMVEVGQYVGPGSPLATVVAAKDKGTAIDIEAWFALPQQRAGLVSDGDTVQIRSDALPVGADGKPAVITGTVVSVSPTADTVTRQFPMRVRVTDQRLKPGMAVRARLLTEMPQKQVMIPVDATVVSTLGQVVYRMLPPAAEGELPSVEAVPIETGEFVDKLVVVTKSELKPGDMIVTRGKEQLYPTAKIIPTNLKPPEGAPAPGGPPAEGAPAPADPAAETKTEGKTETAK
jgi:multidrug efflux system membrane fusion protein